MSMFFSPNSNLSFSLVIQLDYPHTYPRLQKKQYWDDIGFKEESRIQKLWILLFLQKHRANTSFPGKSYDLYAAWSRQDKPEVPAEHVQNAELEDTTTSRFLFLPFSRKPSMCCVITARHFFHTHLLRYILKHRRSVLHYLKSLLTSDAIQLKEFVRVRHMGWCISQEARGNS